MINTRNTNPLGLGEFMSDPTALDRYKRRISLYVGEVQGVRPGVSRWSGVHTAGEIR